MKFGICMDGIEPQFEALIRSLAASKPFLHYLEIGVATGETLRAVCHILDSTNRPYTAIGIDPAPMCESDLHFTIITGHSQTCLTSWGAPIDLCLIDGCHCYDCCRQDFLLVEPHITSGGCVLFHDFGPPVVQETADQHGSERRPLKVWQVVKDLGLLDNQRPGWAALPVWTADFANRQGHDMAVFQRQ